MKKMKSMQKKISQKKTVSVLLNLKKNLLKWKVGMPKAMQQHC